MLTTAALDTRHARRTTVRALATVGVAALLIGTATLAGAPASAAAQTGRVAPAAAPSPPAPTGTKRPVVTYGIGPATNGRPDRRTGLNFSISPGGVASDTVVVVNDSAHPLTLNLYAADGVQSASGTIEYDPRATPGSGARTWVTLHTPHGAPTVTLRGRSTEVVPVSVKVPANATPGDHAVGIVVSLTAKAETTNGQRLNFDQGVGLSVAFHVSGALVPALRVDNLTAAYGGTANPFGEGSATVRFTVHNVGNVTLGAAQHVDVSGLIGSSGTARALADVPALLPGSSIAETVRIADVVPAVRLDAHVRLTPKPVVGEVVDGLAPVSAESGFWAVPWALLVLIALIAAFAATVVVWRRRHPATRSKHSTKRGHARQGDLVAGKA